VTRHGDVELWQFLLANVAGVASVDGGTHAPSSQGALITLSPDALVRVVASRWPWQVWCLISPLCSQICPFCAITVAPPRLPMLIRTARLCSIAGASRKIETVFNTLAYFDGIHFAARANSPTLFSTALTDEICPPSTIFAAYNHYAGPKQIKVWPYNGHEGGETFQSMEKLRFLAHLWR
jgi:hypothetical protein